MTARTFVCLTNIPTPYRLFHFRQMHRELERRGWKFEVWFMARSESRRHWVFDELDFDFPHRFLRGVHVRIGSDTLHVNPEVLGCLRETKPEILLVAGGWGLPTVWLASVSSVPRKIFWSESHLASIRRSGSAIGLARRFFLRKFREFAVPGELAKEYVRAHTANSQIHLLPNLVDPVVFRDAVTEVQRVTRPRRSGARRVLLIAARLAPEKGLVPFLDSLLLLNAEDRSKLSVVIAGSGPLLSDLTHRIASYDFDVHLVGLRSQTEMVKLYADADGFCLPSLSDPNPLAVIEASWAGLPLLLSMRVGNHVECLKTERNGFVFDPTDCKSVREAVSRWLSLSEKELLQFGEGSLDIAMSKFAPETVISEFLDDLMVGEPSVTSVAMTAAR